MSFVCPIKASCSSNSFVLPYTLIILYKRLFIANATLRETRA